MPKNQVRDIPSSNRIAKEFATAKGRISTSKENLRFAFERYRVNVGEDELFRLIGHFSKHSAFRYFVWPNPCPASHQDASRPGMPTVNTFDRELLWATAALFAYSDLISDFIKFKHAFDSAILSGKLEDASGILDDCDKKFGASIWSTENRLNLVYVTKSGAARQAISDAIMKNNKIPMRIRLHLLWSSVRTEKTISALQFERMIKAELQQNGGLSYLRALTMGVCPEIDESIAAYILAYADTSSVIDRYIAYKCVIQALLANYNFDFEPLRRNLQTIQRLVGKVKDFELDFIAILLGSIEGKICRSEALYDATDCYLEGRFESAIDIAKKAVTDATASIELMLIIIKSSQRLKVDPKNLADIFPKETIGRKIFEDLIILSNNQESALDAKVRLAKIASIHASCCWAAAIENVLNSEVNTLISRRSNTNQVYAYLRSSAFLPNRAYMCFHGRLPSTSIIDVLFGQDPSKTSLINRIIYARDPNYSSEIDAIGLSDESNLSAKAATSALLRDFSSSIQYLRALLQTDLPEPVKDEHRTLLTEVLVKAKNLTEACEECASLYMKSTYFATKLPLNRLTKLIIEDQEEENFARTRGELSTAIVFDMYARHRSSNRDAEKADSYKDFLRSQSVQHASELHAVLSDHDQKQIIYFLRNICVPEVLDQSLYLENTREVEDERAKILLLLSDITDKKDQDAQDKLIEELRSIRTKQVLRDATMRIDQSKIYVNMEGLRRSVDSQMRESWRRYKLTVDSDFSADIVHMGLIIKQGLNEKNSFIAVRVPTVERIKLFDNIFIDLLDLFTTSKEFGLDANLSTNIRHGYVVKELRNPLVALRLVTNKGSIDAGYRENDYWLSKLSEGSQHRDTLSRRLSEFSEQIDKEIERLNYQLLRLRTDANPDGLFDFRFSDAVKRPLESACSKCSTYDEFMDLLSSVLWQATEQNLAKVRDTLRLIVSPNLTNALNQLQSDLYAAGIGHALPELNSAIASVRPELGHAIARVSSWFVLSEDTEFPDFSIGTAFEAGLQTVKSYYSHLNINSSFHAPGELQLKGFTLPLFARLFFIILDNAAFHSGDNRTQLLLETSIEMSGKTIHLRIANDLASDKDVGLLERDVKNVLDKYSKDSAPEYVRLEGGSGYPKIWKLLTHDLRCPHDLDLSITQDPKFVVDLSFDARNLIP